MDSNVVTIIHVFVNQTKIEFDTNQVSGAQIKTKAGIPLDHDLARRVQGQLELVTNEQVIEIKNGDHFVDLPAGTIS